MPITSAQAKYDWFFPFGRFFLRPDDSPSNLREAGPGSGRPKPRGLGLREAELRKPGASEGGGFGRMGSVRLGLRKAETGSAFGRLS